MPLISFLRSVRWRRSVAGFVLFMVAGCAASPDFVTPQPPVTQQYTATGDDALQGDQRIVRELKPACDWWLAFESSALDQVMEQALTDNHDLAAMQARVARMREEVNIAAGALWPQASFGGEAGRQQYGVALFGPSNITIPAFTYYSVGPQVTYLLDIAGGQHRAIERQQALAEYQGCQFDAVRLSLTGQVMSQALAIASARAQIAVIEDLIADDRVNIDLAEKAREAGAGTLAEVLHAQSELAGDQTLLPPLRQQQSIAEHALAILVGLAPADWQPPAFALSAFRLPHDLPLRLPSELVRVRPDIRAVEAQLHAASAAVGVAAANLYPNLTLSANIMQEALSPENLFTASANAWAMAARLTAPIFSGGTLQAEKRAAEEAYRATLADYQQVVIESFGQVANVLKALEHDAEEIQAGQQAVETARSSLKLARLSYGAGATGVLQVLDAERLSKQARLGLTRARVRQLQDTALLYLALGGDGLTAK